MSKEAREEYSKWYKPHGVTAHNAYVAGFDRAIALFRKQCTLMLELEERRQSEPFKILWVTRDVNMSGTWFWETIPALDDCGMYVSQTGAATPGRVFKTKHPEIVEACRDIPEGAGWRILYRAGTNEVVISEEVFDPTP